MAEGVQYGAFEKDNGKFGFIRQDAERSNIFVLSWSCTGFDGSFPPLGTRVAYEVVTDAKTGKPRADNVRPESSADAQEASAEQRTEMQQELLELLAGAQEGCPMENRTGCFKRNGGKWGFISQDCDESDLFVLPHSCTDKVFPEEGTRVKYDLIFDQRTGRPRAENVRLENSEDAPRVYPVEGDDEWRSRDGKASGKGDKAGRSDRSEASEDPDSLEPLSRTLASILRHRAPTLGIHIRADGFASLNDVLANSGLSHSIERVLPGCVESIKASKVVPDQLIQAVKTIVGTSMTNGRPRFELWEDDSSGKLELWIRATHKHSMAHVWMEEAADESAQLEQSDSQAATQQTENSTWSALLGDDRDARKRSENKTVEVFAISTPPRQRPNSEQQSKPNPAIAFRANDADPWGGCKAWGASGTAGNGSAVTRPPPPILAEQVSAFTKPAIASSLPGDLSKTVGRIRSFNPEKGFGFIVCDSVEGDVFLNANAIVGEHPPKCIGYPNNPAMGPEMRFDLELRGGKPRAINASLVGEASTETTQTPQKSEASESVTESMAMSRTEEDHFEYEEMRPQDILKMLPHDAPDCVWKYLQALAQTQGGA